MTKNERIKRISLNRTDHSYFFLLIMMEKNEDIVDYDSEEDSDICDELDDSAMTKFGLTESQLAGLHLYQICESVNDERIKNASPRTAKYVIKRFKKQAYRR